MTFILYVWFHLRTKNTKMAIFNVFNLHVNIKLRLPFNKSLRIYQIVKKLLMAFAFVIAAFLLHIHLIVSDI